MSASHRMTRSSEGTPGPASTSEQVDTSPLPMGFVTTERIWVATSAKPVKGLNSRLLQRLVGTNHAFGRIPV